jgi:hypothetical protein
MRENKEHRAEFQNITPIYQQGISILNCLKSHGQSNFGNRFHMHRVADSIPINQNENMS